MATGFCSHLPGVKFLVVHLNYFFGLVRWLCKCLKIGWFGCGFWLVERGGLMVNRGDLCGFCMVIYGLKLRQLLTRYFSIGWGGARSNASPAASWLIFSIAEVDWRDDE